MGTQKTDNFDSADLHQNTQWKKKKKTTHRSADL